MTFPPKFSALLLCLAPALPLLAQQPDTLDLALPEIRIEAARATETAASAAFAVGVLERAALVVATAPGVSLEDVLVGLPGLWIGDRSHFALGERLAVRGQGWRAAFGVRGVYVLLDGLPLTMPDGQTVIDFADPAFVRSAELMRGPASLFWGNAGGGVLFLSTAAFAPSPSLRLRAVGGTHGLRQLSAEASLAPGRHRLHAFASDTRRDGFREHSAGRFTRAGLHAGLDLGPRTQLLLVGALADQDALNPGALTQQQVQDDPRLADPRNVATSAGKRSTQGQVGATLHHETPLGLFSATAHGLVRDLDNPLSFAFVGLNRRAGGVRASLQSDQGRISWTLGLDAAAMRDDRENRDNVAGQAGGARSLDQRETVTTLAFFSSFGLPLTTRARLTLGLRADRIRFAMDDRLLANEDQSGQRTFAAWSPALGLAYALGPALLFANYRTAFETPTTTELVNRPDLDGGFNPSLDPQRTHGFEVGARGVWAAARLHYDLALYHLRVEGLVAPFQTPEGGDRTFFRNAGATRHSGLEAAGTWQPVEALSFQCSYTYGHFTFAEDALDGNRLPGLPAHLVNAHLTVTGSQVFGHFAARGVSRYFVEDTNLERNGGYAVFDIRLGHPGLWLGTARLVPFVQLENVLDTHYNGSVIVNARGGRYYEPAPGRSVQAGLSLAF